MVAPRDLRVSSELRIPGAEIREAASRSRGPGGQHVNKTSTRVSLRWNLEASDVLSAAQRRRLRARLGARISRTGDLAVHCDRTRSRARNRELARERLAELLAGALAQARPRKATRPSPASKARRLESKQRRGKLKRGRGRIAPDTE